MSSQLSKERDEDKSENDISELTDQTIFQGAFSLLNKGISNNNNNIQIHQHGSQHQHENQYQQKQKQEQKQEQKSPQQQQIQSNNQQHQIKQQQKHSETKDEQIRPKILQNLTKTDQPNNIAASNSMYSSGILSFRNKKAYFQMPQHNQNNQRNEENIDHEAITQSILEKMNTIKKKSKETFASYSYEQREIGKMLNNDSTKAYEEEYDEKDIKVENGNSSDDHCNSNSEGNNKDNDNDNDDQESNRVFWHFKKDEDNTDLSGKRQHNYFAQITSSNKRKHKFLNRIVCTLSMLEQGKAIFVSQDDMIFVLPALFVPKNLSVGNTYVFKVRECEPFSSKSNNIREIQKKYI